MPTPEANLHRLQCLRQITAELTSTLDVAEVLNQIVRLTASALEVKGCALRLLNERTRELTLSAAWGLSDDYLTKGPVHTDHSLSACMKGEIVHIQNVRTDSRIEYPEHAESEGIVSMLSLPLISHEKFVGVLRLYSEEERDFPEAELEYAQTLACLGTLAIEHSRLYSQLKEDHNNLIEDFHVWFERGVYAPPEGPA